jgi:hypothetical protein
VLQDPADAQAPSMPRSALAGVEAAHVMPLAALGPLLYGLASRAVVGTAAGRPEPPATLRQEHAVSHGNPQGDRQPVGLYLPQLRQRICSRNSRLRVFFRLKN